LFPDKDHDGGIPLRPSCFLEFGGLVTEPTAPVNSNEVVGKDPGYSIEVVS